MLDERTGGAMRALISVYDKRGVADFARGLTELGWEIVASGGTAAHLEEQGVPVTRVESLTGFAELLGHRVVTLHPAVHGGILARRDLPEDVADLEEHGIEPFDLVCVGLYPFEEHESVEMIDVGGPSMLRGAAKNFEYVAAVCLAGQYASVLDELRRNGSVSPETRRRLAAEAFATTAAYEAAIASWFSRDATLPAHLTLSLEKAADLAYGENPHQRSAFYGDAAAIGEQLHGKPLSYNNLHDLDAARALLAELAGPACVIVKHANPCGAAIAASIEDAYAGALASDPVSAYGGVVAVNRSVSGLLAARLAEQFIEVLSAPEYEQPAALQEKPSLRILRSAQSARSLDYRSALGGLLVQEPDVSSDEMELVCGELSDEDRADLAFAWTVCKHVTSNAVVLAKGGRTIGIGAGQMSRVDAVRIAVEKAREHGHELTGAVLASDAFFPFADGPQIALDAGVRAIVQPGGSKRDDEVIEAVRASGAAMVFTGRRHFRH
ncbi:MAG TPA: bifunctional phosphoribosylaminoimidazolecarboxamide formyltransferase/IMP cyclohydrolase [Gaiellaceae bacterium]|nr:bifunctional phosphoribosylaminoimidazolecarboxamide formyltransferase/IMP cyclohydrolase [Gaiellaceae bacterium]